MCESTNRALIKAMRQAPTVEHYDSEEEESQSEGIDKEEETTDESESLRWQIRNGEKYNIKHLRQSKPLS